MIQGIDLSNIVCEYEVNSLTNNNVITAHPPTNPPGPIHPSISQTCLGKIRLITRQYYSVSFEEYSVKLYICLLIVAM